jgi:subtilisin family serine protease
LDAVGATRANLTGEEVTVAVLDTGIDPRHPAFDGVALVRENFTSEGDDDTDGHGTHCAGTIFGRDVGNVRIGIARGVRRALIGKVIGNDAGTDALIKAIKWAYDNGAHVISMSLGYDHVNLFRWLARRMPEEKAMSETFAAVIENLRLFDRLVSLLSVQSFDKAGVVIVAASGNESEALRPQDPYRLYTSSPSSAEGVLPVGALAKSPNGKLVVAPFLNTGVQLSAPGVDIISAKRGGGLRSTSGTSMACPHVAGIAALHWADVFRRQLPVKADTVIARLLASASTAQIDRNGLAVADFGVGCVQAPAQN